MKCPANCRCGKHDQHHPRHVYNNTTFSPKRRALTSTYGQQQRERQNRMMAERKAAGIPWRGTPSEEFDWDRAIVGLHRILGEVYG